MRIYNYRKVYVLTQYKDQAEVLTKQVVPLLEEEYDVSITGTMFKSIRKQLSYYLHFTDGELEDKIILDLGCGSKQSKDSDPDKYEFLPLGPRALEKLGVHVFGIDIADLETELFEHYEVDLLPRKSLEFLMKNYAGEIDIANAFGLFTSPTSQYRWGSLFFKRRITNQLKKLVKPEGYFLYFL